MGRQSARGDRWIAAALFVVCLVLYHLAPVRQLYDWRYITAVSHSLLHEGDLSVDPALAERARYQIKQVGDDYYHLFPNAPAVLNLPFVWGFERLGLPVFDDGGRFLGGSENRILRAAAASATAAAVAVLFLVARLWLAPGWALGLALVFAFGSPLLSTASRPFWSHSWGVLLLALALYGCLARPARGERWHLAGAATALAWAVFTRPPFALSAVALTALLAAGPRRRRALPVFVGVGAAWLAAFCLHSLIVFGELVPPYFYSATTASGRLTAERLLSFQGEAALGTLVSPARGLFVFTPFLVAVLWVVARHWRALADRAAAVAGLAVIAAHWYLVSSFRNWRGGASYGPRLMTDLMPWFLVLAALGLAAVLARGRDRPAGRWRPARRAVVGLLVAASLFIHARGATSRAGMKHYGVWNWRCPPFLIGLVPVPGLPAPGALLVYDAAVDRNPVDGWSNLTGRRGFDLELHDSISHTVPRGAPPGIGGAFVFRGAGGGTAAPVQELGGRPNLTEAGATLELWLRPGPDDGTRVLFESGGGDRGLTLFLRQGRPGLEVRSGGRRRSVVLESPTPLDRRSFSQLAAVLRPLAEGAELALYVDGRLAAGPRAAPEIDDWAGGDRTGVGTDDARPSYHGGDFSGEIAILRLYPEALTAGQVAHNYRAVAEPP